MRNITFQYFPHKLEILFPQTNQILQNGLASHLKTNKLVSIEAPGYPRN